MVATIAIGRYITAQLAGQYNDETLKGIYLFKETKSEY